MCSDVESSEVLVLGASFAGIEFVYQLFRLADGKPPQTTVIDRQPQHGYLPLVQERLCGVLEPEGSRVDTRAFVESVPRARFVCGEVQRFDPHTNVATLANGRRYRGRYVVVALGSSFTAPRELEGHEHVVAYKSQSQFEHARARIEAWKAGEGLAVVVGGGISGCELAGELAQVKSRAGARGDVLLVSANDRLAQPLGPRIGASARRALQQQGVRLELGARVTRVARDAVQLQASSGTRREPAAIVLWAGGVRPAPVLHALGLPQTDAGWLRVTPTLQCFDEVEPRRPNVFACGDAVRVVGWLGEWPTRQRAIECIWQAKIVARNVWALAQHPADYPRGVPPLRPHKLREEFFYGLSLGARSIVAYRNLGVDLPGINHGFRRWLMRRYFSRYAELPSA